MIDTFVAGNIGEAEKIHNDLTPLFDILFCMANPIPVKYAVNQVGFNVGKYRLPLVEPDEKTAAAIMKVVNSYKSICR